MPGLSTIHISDPEHLNSAIGKLASGRSYEVFGHFSPLNDISSWRVLRLKDCSVCPCVTSISMCLYAQICHMYELCVYE